LTSANLNPPPSGSERQSPATLLLPLLPVFVLALAWGGLCVSRGFRISATEAAIASGAEATIGLSDAFPLPVYHHAAANHASRSLFPADHTRARDEARSAIFADPLNALGWLIYARESIYLDDREHARAALETSDRLDPRYPTQRLEAIRLWALLGEPQRATELAAHLGALGSGFRSSAAAELVSTGVDSRVALSVTGGKHLEGSQLMEVLEAMAAVSSSALRDVWPSLEEAKWEDPDVRRRLSRLAERPPVFPAILALWSHDEALEFAANGIPVANQDLSRPPFKSGLNFGWQPAPLEAAATGAWNPAGPSEEPARGAVRLEFLRGTADRFRWTAYRTSLPAGVGCVVRFRVRLVPSNRSEVILYATGSGKAQKGDLSRADLTGWQDLSVTVPARDQAEVVSFVLDWRRKGVPGVSEEIVLFVDGLEILPLPPEPAVAP